MFVHLYKTMKNFLMDFDYYIDIYEDNIHVFNYIDILRLNETEITFAMNGFKLQITGENFTVKRLEKREILIQGKMDNVRFLR